jgi:hypothetical protein
MFMWIVPAAVMGKNLAEFCAPGGLVDRMIRAAAPAEPGQQQNVNRKQTRS